MSIFLTTKLTANFKIMTSQLMTSFHNPDQKFLNSIFFCTCLERAQQEELKTENRLFISQKLKEI